MRNFLSGLFILLFIGCSEPPTLVRLDDFENDASAALVRHLIAHPLIKELPNAPEMYTVIHGPHPETKSASKNFLERFKDSGKILVPKEEITFHRNTKEIYHKRTKEVPVTIQLVSVSPSDISHFRIKSGIAFKQNFIVEEYDVILTDAGPTVKRVNVLEQNWR